jgi:hypothetical protein
MYGHEFLRRLGEGDRDAQAVDRRGRRLRARRRLRGGDDGDFILAADTAKFGQPEIKLGVAPAWAARSA